jgi:hypothetical protein
MMAAPQQAGVSGPTTKTKNKSTGVYLPMNVLTGRGGLSQNHIGTNRVSRRLVDLNRKIYQALTRPVQEKLVHSIVQAIRNKCGRFLKYQSETKAWIEIDYKEAFVS